jgi:phosphoglycerate dehydrogenase-like enzyme
MSKPLTRTICIKLAVDGHEATLAATQRAFNAAASWIAQGCWDAGAGLDDIAEEPAKQRGWKSTNPLFSLDNVVLTPHAAYRNGPESPRLSSGG